MGGLGEEDGGSCGSLFSPLRSRSLLIRKRARKWRFSDVLFLSSWHFAPQSELIKGRPLILMHFQSKTCNRLVDEALEVVILRGPFDHFTSRL